MLTAEQKEEIRQKMALEMSIFEHKIVSDFCRTLPNRNGEHTGEITDAVTAGIFLHLSHRQCDTQLGSELSDATKAAVGDLLSELQSESGDKSELGDYKAIEDVMKCAYWYTNRQGVDKYHEELVEAGKA